MRIQEEAKSHMSRLKDVFDGGAQAATVRDGSWQVYIYQPSQARPEVGWTMMAYDFAMPHHPSELPPVKLGTGLTWPRVLDALAHYSVSLDADWQPAMPRLAEPDGSLPL